MFEITILSFAFNYTPSQSYSLKIRSLSSSKIQYQTDLCSGRSFQWNQKFRCPDDQQIIKFQILNCISTSKKQIVASGVYDFVNRQEDLVTSNQRQVKMLKNGHHVGVVHITVQYVENGILPERGVIPTALTFGQQRNRQRYFETPVKKQSQNSELNWSTTHKIQNMRGGLPTHTIVQKKSREEDIIYENSKQLIRNSYVVAEGAKRLLNSSGRMVDGVQDKIQFVKSESRKRNLFSCMDNWMQEWELVPSVVRRQRLPC